MIYEKAFEKLGSESGKGAQALLEKISPKMSSSLEKALTKVLINSKDPKAKEELQQEILKLLMKNPGLIKEIEPIVINVNVENIDQLALENNPSIKIKDTTGDIYLEQNFYNPNKKKKKTKKDRRGESDYKQASDKQASDYKQASDKQASDYKQALENKLIFTIGGALTAFMVGIILSYITFTIGENMIVSSFSKGGALGSLGGSLTKGILNNYTLQLTGMIYYLSHGIYINIQCINIRSMGLLEPVNIFSLMNYPESANAMLLLLVPLISLLIGGYISAKGTNKLVSGIRAGAYVALPYTLIMALASFKFSLNFSILGSISIDIISTIFFSLITGVLYGGIGGAFRGLLKGN
ncbi:hypothetical protein [Methanosarcina barkeri]|uniref:hypothetical protein n=1 Tax=Methanosarcina barkeri TaxID=2208 RepID=UPI0012D3E3B1|nr:hypothetical protein [Methanosarcina barkeri]